MSKKLPIDEINKLSEILKSQDLTELEVECDDFKIKVRKEQQIAVSNGAIHESPAPAAAAPSAPAAAPAAADPNIFEVKSPMVGTFYASPSPGADNFVKKGQSVNAGDTLCIVEAMKLMNELPAEVSGEVVEICAQDAQAISYGQVIMKIRKS